MSLIQNAKMKLPITGSKQIKNTSFFIVSHEGCEYQIRMFPFQVDKPLPSFLYCWVKDAYNGILTQDRSYYLKDIFTIGECYNFRIKNDFSYQPSNPYFEIIYQNCITTRLYNVSTKKFKVGDDVLCRVVDINDKGGLIVTFVGGGPETEQDNPEGELPDATDLPAAPVFLKTTTKTCCIYLIMVRT